MIEGKKGGVARYFRRHGYEQLQRYEAFDDVNRYFAPKRSAASAPAADPGR